MYRKILTLSEYKFNHFYFRFPCHFLWHLVVVPLNCSWRKVDDQENKNTLSNYRRKQNLLGHIWPQIASEVPVLVVFHSTNVAESHVLLMMLSPADMKWLNVSFFRACIRKNIKTSRYAAIWASVWTAGLAPFKCDFIYTTSMICFSGTHLFIM